jgi:hypothetical protein
MYRAKRQKLQAKKNRMAKMIKLRVAWEMLLFMGFFRDRTTALLLEGDHVAFGDDKRGISGSRIQFISVWELAGRNPPGYSPGRNSQSFGDSDSGHTFIHSLSLSKSTLSKTILLPFPKSVKGVKLSIWNILRL